MFKIERIDSKSMVHIGYRSIQVLSFAMSFSATAASLVCILLGSPSLLTSGDPLAFLLSLVVVAASYIGLITAMGLLTTRLSEQEPRTIHRQAALICSERRNFERHLDIVFVATALYVISGISIQIGSTSAALPAVAISLHFLSTFSLLFLGSIVSAVLFTRPQATKSKVDKLSERLNRELTGMYGVDMNQANKLLTLLISQGKYSEADELSRKLMALAEQSPELIN